MKPAPVILAATLRVEAILAAPESPEVPKLEAEIGELVFDLYGLTATKRALVLSARADPFRSEFLQDEVNLNFS